MLVPWRRKFSSRGISLSAKVEKMVFEMNEWGEKVGNGFRNKRLSEVKGTRKIVQRLGHLSLMY